MLRRPPRSLLFLYPLLFFFFFNDTATTEIYTLSLHDALPISMTFFVSAPIFVFREFMRHRVGWCLAGDTEITLESEAGPLRQQRIGVLFRSEEHTSELQSLRHLVCRLLLENRKAHV